MIMLQFNNCTVLRDELLGNDLHNFHNFFHQLLVLWINHVVLSLMSQLVHIFSLTMLSFVSTSSLTVFVFPQVLRSQSDVAAVSLLVPKLHTRASSAPKLRIVRPMQSTNHRFASNFPGFTNSFSNSFDSSSRFVRLENHAEFGYLTPCDLTPDLWRSAFTGSIDSARSQPFLLLLQLLRLLQLLKAFQRSWSVCCCTVLQRVNPSGYSSPSIHRDVLHHLLMLLLLQPSLTNMFRPFADFASRQWFRECICWILLTCNNIQLQVTKRHSTLQPQMTRLQLSQTSSDSSSSCNTSCC